MYNLSEQIESFCSLLEEHECDKKLFSFGEYAEGCVCLEKRGYQWTVYIADHGQEEMRAETCSLKGAMISVAKILTDSSKKEISLINDIERRFKKYVKKESSINNQKQCTKKGYAEECIKRDYLTRYPIAALVKEDDNIMKRTHRYYRYQHLVLRKTARTKPDENLRNEKKREKPIEG